MNRDISNLLCNLSTKTIYSSFVNKQLLKKIGVMIAVWLLQMVFSNVSIFGKVFPAGLSFSFARLYFGANVIVVTLEYALSKVLLCFNFKWLIVTAFEIVMLALFYFANEFFKIKHKYLRVAGFVVVSKMLELYLALYKQGDFLIVFLGIILSVLYALYFLRLFVFYKNKSLFFKFSKLDHLIFSVFTLTLFLGLFGCEIISKYLYLFFVTFSVVMMCRVLEPEKALVNSGVVALAFCLGGGRCDILIFVIVLSSILSSVRDFGKYLFASVTLIICTVFVYLFNFYNIFELFSLYFAVFLFILCPQNLVRKISQAFEVNANEVITKEIMKQKIASTKGKLELMGETFMSMNNSFKFLLVGKVSKEKASVELSQDVINRCCKTCENYKICFAGNIQKKTSFDALLYRAFLNKQVSFDDVSTGLQTYCNKTSIIVSEINQIASRFLGYESAMKNEDSSKLMIASELENFSNIFSNFAKFLKIDCKINQKSSKNIKEMFLKSLIDVKEVVVYENESGIESVNIVASNAEVLKTEVAKSIFKVTKVKMEIESIKHLDISGISLATFVPAEKIRLDFAVSTKAKESVNGDSSTVVKLSKDRYLVAITDGMGHGERASRVSSMVVSLIESMFKVGLDDSLIVDSINKLLLPVGLDNFTTLDACVIDTKTSTAQFIKLGSSVSLLKHGESTEVISCDSLPLGVVQEVKPKIITKQIFVGDIILLASDGVVDSFDSIEQYKNFVNDSNIFNLKSYTDSLIFDASYQNQAHPDDMTVIAINLLKK